MMTNEGRWALIVRAVSVHDLSVPCITCIHLHRGPHPVPPAPAPLPLPHPISLLQDQFLSLELLHQQGNMQLFFHLKIQINKSFLCPMTHHLAYFFTPLHRKNPALIISNSLLSCFLLNILYSDAQPHIIALFCSASPITSE
jgi:hypothetical protein